jgi:putative transposase
LALVMALLVVMYQILLQGSPQRRFSKQDQPRQTFFFDRSHPAFRIRVGMSVQLRRMAMLNTHAKAYVERLIGSIRRECLDHVIVLKPTGVHRVLKSYFQYYERTRTQLCLEKDAPIPRRVQPPELGKVVELPEVGGLHHRYERRAA